ncbi:Uncharacterized protein TCM_031763 [Theobroma cacao]|uniref:Uncharacterized protein n=1 Tax=Theobroma cacao TaxID=3641 RepID=A0A061F978_THECC|nr:Uncharacterized protein TCM_031763 [Theobroma cacao]
MQLQHLECLGLCNLIRECDPWRMKNEHNDDKSDKLFPIVIIECGIICVILLFISVTIGIVLHYEIEEKGGLGVDEEEEEIEIEAPAWFFPTILGTSCCIFALLAGILCWLTKNYVAGRAVKGQGNASDDVLGNCYIVINVVGFSFSVVLAIEFALLTTFMIRCPSVAAMDPIPDVKMPVDGQPDPRIASSESTERKKVNRFKIFNTNNGRIIQSSIAATKMTHKDSSPPTPAKVRTRNTSDACHFIERKEFIRRLSIVLHFQIVEKAGLDGDEEETEIEAPPWAVKGQSNEADDLSGYYYILPNVVGFSFLVVMAVELALLTTFMIMCPTVAATDPISDVEMPADDQPDPRIASDYLFQQPPNLSSSDSKDHNDSQRLVASNPCRGRRKLVWVVMKRKRMMKQKSKAPAWFFHTILGTACCLFAVLAGILYWQTRNYVAERAVKGQSTEADDLSGYYYIAQHVFGFSFLVVMAVEFTLLRIQDLICYFHDHVSECCSYGSDFGRRNAC